MMHSSLVEISERHMEDVNATETASAGEDSTVPPSSNALGDDPVESPIAQSPTEDVSPVAPPVSAPVSAPIAEEAFPISAPVSAPTFEDLSPTFATPVSSPVSFPSKFDHDDAKWVPVEPSPSTTEEIETFLLNPFHLIVIACIVGVVTLLLFWKCCKSWKLRREKHLLRLQSTQVDAVLGDMQMVGMGDYDDDDPELI